MSIDIIDDKALWDGFIEESPQGMLFHRWDFLKIIEKYTHYRLLPYGIYDGRELACVMPMFYKNTKGIKMAYSPPQGTLAYIPYLGPVMSGACESLTQYQKEERFGLVWRDIRRELKKLSPNFTSMMLVRDVDDIRPFVWDGYDVEILYTYVVDLRKPIEEVWEGLEGNCRRFIKKGASSGLSVQPGGDVDKLHSIIAGRLKDKGNTFFARQSPEYLKELISAYPENLQMTLLYLNDEAIGAKLNCYYKGFYMGWCGGSEVGREDYVNEFFEWETIKTAKSLGCSWYENWGADMRHLNQFKAKLNPALVPYYHVKKKDTIGRLSDWGYDVVSGNPYLGFVKNLI